nr:hypothetical protein [Candidatus Orientia mediorientalis]
MVGTLSCKYDHLAVLLASLPMQLVEQGKYIGKGYRTGTAFQLR